MKVISGRVAQIIGPVVDVAFDSDIDELPSIHDALEITRDDGRKLIVEVQQHIGEDMVRCVAMDLTTGLRRGMEARYTGGPITRDDIRNLRAMATPPSTSQSPPKKRRTNPSSSFITAKKVSDKNMPQKYYK